MIAYSLYECTIGIYIECQSVVGKIIHIYIRVYKRKIRLTLNKYGKIFMQI